LVSFKIKIVYHRELLEVNGFKVFSSVNGEVGFEKIVIFKPAYIVGDMMMPQTDGCAFLKLMKANDETSKIISLR